MQYFIPPHMYVLAVLFFVTVLKSRIENWPLLIEAFLYIKRKHYIHRKANVLSSRALCVPYVLCYEYHSEENERFVVVLIRDLLIMIIMLMMERTAHSEWMYDNDDDGGDDDDGVVWGRRHIAAQLCLFFPIPPTTKTTTAIYVCDYTIYVWVHQLNVWLFEYLPHFWCVYIVHRANCTYIQILQLKNWLEPNKAKQSAKRENEKTQRRNRSAAASVVLCLCDRTTFIHITAADFSYEITENSQSSFDDRWTKNLYLKSKPSKNIFINSFLESNRE